VPRVTVARVAVARVTRLWAGLAVPPAAVGMTPPWHHQRDDGPQDPGVGGGCRGPGVPARWAASSRTGSARSLQV